MKTSKFKNKKIKVQVEPFVQENTQVLEKDTITKSLTVPVFFRVFNLIIIFFIFFGLWIRFGTLENNKKNVQEIVQEYQEAQLIQINSKPVKKDLVETKPKAFAFEYKSREYKNLPPVISAKAYGVYDLKNNAVVYFSNESLPLHPASLTKLMTALIALDNYELNQKVVMPVACTVVEGSKVGFKANETFYLEDILYGLLVKSGADAACALAEIEGSKTYLEKMNKKALDLGMVKTTYKNTIGLSVDANHASTVADLALLSKYIFENYSVVQKIVGTKNYQINSLNSKSIYRFSNTNELLFSVPGTIGLKTGYTEQAKECLSYMYESKGKKFMIIVLGSDDRFGDAKKLLDWVLEESYVH